MLDSFIIDLLDFVLLHNYFLFDGAHFWQTWVLVVRHLGGNTHVPLARFPEGVKVGQVY